MTRQKRFTKEFEDDAIRLALTSGRTRRSITPNLGVGLSTLTREIGRARDSRPAPPDGLQQMDLAAELKRLGLENEVLRQDRDIRKLHRASP